MSKKEYKEIPLDQILQPALQVRLTIDPVQVTELANSIKEVGILEPLLVNNLSNEKYEIIAGHRRYLSAKEAGMLFAPCIVMEIDELQADTMKIHENLYRADINALEEGVFFTQLQERRELSIDDIAQMISKSPNYVRQRIDAVEWDDELKQKVNSNQLSFSQAREIAYTKNPDTRSKMTEWAAKGGATVQTISSWRKEYDRVDAPQNDYEPPAPLPEQTEPPPALIRCDGCLEMGDIYKTVTYRFCPECAEIMEKAKQGGETSV